MTEQFGASDMTHTMADYAADLKATADFALPEDPTLLAGMLTDLGAIMSVVQPLQARVAEAVMDGEELRETPRRR